MKITLCASSKFFDKLVQIKSNLENLGHEVLTTSMNQFREEDAEAKIKYNLIKEHFNKINRSDAILVVNIDHKGIKGYIGGNSFLEMGKAYDKEIPIFLLNQILEELSYSDEIKAMQPVVINGNLEMIMINEYEKDLEKLIRLKTPEWKRGWATDTYDEICARYSWIREFAKDVADRFLEFDEVNRTSLMGILMDTNKLYGIRFCK